MTDKMGQSISVGADPAVPDKTTDDITTTTAEAAQVPTHAEKTSADTTVTIPAKIDTTADSNMAETVDKAKDAVTAVTEQVKNVVVGEGDEAKGPSKSAQKKAEKEAKKAAEKAAKAAKLAANPAGPGKKQDDTIGLTVKKAENFSQWYQEVVLKSEMIEYYTEISGFFVMRPATMYIWNVIRRWFTEQIELIGVDETNFPMFLSSKSLEKEKDHVEGFAPELAWVTKAYVFWLRMWLLQTIY
jgi:chemotaxis protein histidine kinase CheA